MAIKIHPKNFMWGSIVAIVLIFVFYSIYTKKGIKTFEIPGKLKIEFEDQVIGPSLTSSGENYITTTGVGNFYIQPPGKSRIALSSIERILIEPGIDDPINRHRELVLKALESGNMRRTFQETDLEGMFNMWITSQEFPDCYYYSTLLQRNDGTKQLAFRKACKSGDKWSSEISPELRELMGASEYTSSGDFTGSTSAQIKSLREVMSCLESHEQSIIRGLYTPSAVVNLCFVEGEVTKEEFDSAERGNLFLGQQLLLTMEAAYSIAKFGYALYQQEEYIGSKLFFEAMSLLNSHDSYFHNMVGASQMGMNNFNGAIPSFDQAIQNDPQNVHALLNRAECLMRLNRMKEAKTDLYKVIEYDQEEGTPSARRSRQLLEDYY